MELTEKQQELLDIIRRYPGSTNLELASRSGRQPGPTSVTVGVLYDLGLIYMRQERSALGYVKTTYYAHS